MRLGRCVVRGCVFDPNGSGFCRLVAARNFCGTAIGCNPRSVGPRQCGSAMEDGANYHVFLQSRVVLGKRDSSDSRCMSAPYVFCTNGYAKADRRI